MAMAMATTRRCTVTIIWHVHVFRIRRNAKM